MRNPFEFKIIKYQADRSRKTRWQKFITILASVVVFCSTYALVLPSLTWERQLICETEEHTHTQSCYQSVTVIDSKELICTIDHEHTDECYQIVSHQQDELICIINEHIHSDSCYDAPAGNDSGYYCGQYMHIHNEDCYYENGTLKCTIPVHEHTLECEINHNADVETESDWMSSFNSAEIIGNWSNDVVQIAKTQLGYKESEHNFIISDNEKKGYSRYGAFAGKPYDDWSVSFCRFVLKYAGVSKSNMPYGNDYQDWVKKLELYNLYKDVNEYIPVAGDLAFFADGKTIGIVTNVEYSNYDESTVIEVIAGDYDNRVAKISYNFLDEKVAGYGILPEEITVKANTIRNIITLDASCNVVGNYNWQWQKSFDGQNWNNISGANDLAYVFDVSKEIEGTSYRIIGSIKTADAPAYLTIGKEKAPNKIVSAAFTPSYTIESEQQDNYVLLITGSDFQDPKTSYSNFGGKKDYSTQVSRIQNILNEITSQYGDAYGFIAGGDYNFDETKSSDSKTQTGITTIKNAVTSVLGNNIDTVFVQGNHDKTGCGTDPSGNNDTDYYGVFVMNEEDYRADPKSSSKWSDTNKSEQKASDLADLLDEYLADKVENNYDKPVFIVSHVPLHYSTRTKANSDGIYADYFYNVISEYADKLNIIFLYGHNHAWGDDDYLGGGAVFLKAGDSINIAVHGDKDKYQSLPLNFTYMNYGYTGYYWDKWAGSASDVEYSNADDTLTMTAFLISGNKVIVSRWDEENGMHDLKSIGAATRGFRNIAEVCEVTTSIYGSPQTISLIESVSPDPIDTDTVKTISNCTEIYTSPDFCDKLSGMRITSGNNYDLIVSSINNEKIPFIVYDINLASGTTIPAEGIDLYFATAQKMRVFSIAENNQFEWVDEDEVDFVTLDGKTFTHFKAHHFSIYGYAGYEIDFTFPEVEEPSLPTTETITTYTQVNSTSDLANGDKIILYNTRTSKYLSNQKNGGGLRIDSVAQENAVIFTVEKYNNQLYLKYNTQYVTASNNSAGFADSRSAVLQYVSGNSCWQINNGDYYLYSNKSNSNNVYGNKSDASSEAGSRWQIYKVAEEEVAIEYWIKCDSRSDFDTASDSIYMIVREDAKMAFGVNGGNSEKTSVNIVPNSVIGGRQIYTISGSGLSSDFNWKFANINYNSSSESSSTYRIRNVGSTSYYICLNSSSGPVSTTYTDNVLANPQEGTWQVKNGSYYLTYTNSKFSKNNSDANSYMSFYKKVDPSKIVNSQLAVTKILTSSNEFADENTSFIFRLTSSRSGNNASAYSASTAVSAGYTVYNYDGTVAGTYQLSTINSVDGCFTLLAGQTALFTDLDTSKYYFISERESDNIVAVSANSVNSQGNETAITVNKTGTFNWVNVSYETINTKLKRAHIQIFNTPKVSATLEVVKKVATVVNPSIDEKCEFTFRLSYSENGISDYDYSNAAFATGQYKLYDGEGNYIGTYDLSTAEGSEGCFILKDNQRAVFSGLDSSKFYFVSEKVSDDISTVNVKVNDVATTTKFDSSYYWVAASFEDDSNSNKSVVEFINTPVSLISTLDITLQIYGADEHIPDDAQFNIYIIPENYDSSSTEEIGEYEIVVNTVVLATGTCYANTPIALEDGQTLRIKNIGNGNYIVKEQLGNYEPYIVGTIVDDGNTNYSRINPDNENNISVNVNHEGFSEIIIMHKLQGVYEVTFDFGDGQNILVLTDENGHIPAPWPTKERTGWEFIGWRTERTVVGNDIENSEQETYQFTHDTTLYAHWVPWTVDDFDRDAEVNKTLRQSTAYKEAYNTENVFDIDLDCYLPTTEKMGVVLILDISTSMDSMCLKCGHFHNNETNCPTSDSNTGYDGTSITHNNSQYHKDDAKWTSRMTASKNEGCNFLDRLYSEVYGKECWVQVIMFGDYVKVHTDCVNIGSDAIYQNGRTAVEYLKNIIQTTTVLSGTNIAEGIYTAYQDLQNIITDHGVRGQDTYAILLSDGAPTTNDDDNIASYNYNSAETAEYMSADYISKWMNTWSKYDHYDYDVNGWTGFNKYDLTPDDTGLTRNVNSGKIFKPGMIMAPPYYADLIRDNLGSRFYSVMFGHNQDRQERASADNWKYVAGIGIDNQDYIASFSDYSTTATSSEELQAFYSRIIQSVKVVCTDAMIIDPMGENVEFLYFTDDEGNIIEDSERLYGNVHGFEYKYDEETRTIIWYPNRSGVLHYKVRIKNEKEGFEDYYDSGEGREYPTNGLTIFKYSIKVGNNPIAERSKTIDVPYVHGWLADFDFTKYGGFTLANKHPLKGATFYLVHDPNCPYCHDIKEGLLEVESRDGEIYHDQLATIVIDSVVSDENGVVSFKDIPSGHTYILTETPPAGYIGIPADGYKVEVYHDEDPSVDHAVIKVTATGNYSEYWDIDSQGHFTLFNLQTDGAILPETGGRGNGKAYLIGTLLIAISTLFGFRKKKE